MARLDGKVILITGGARGQGEAEARRCTAEGASVVITDILDGDGKAVAADISATYHHHDVVSSSDWTAVVDATIEQHGRIDGLVNNAGIFVVKAMLDTDEATYRRVVDVNQVGVYLGMAAVAPSMVEHGGGSIVNISSIAGMRGAAVAFAYGASKWAVRGMTKSAAVELGPHQIRVNSVHPGLIDTQMLAELSVMGDDWKEQLAQRVPIGRLASADDVADVVLFLLSDESRYCSGQEFVVDGAVTA